MAVRAGRAPLATGPTQRGRARDATTRPPRPACGCAPRAVRAHNCAAGVSSSSTSEATKNRRLDGRFNPSSSVALVSNRRNEGNDQRAQGDQEPDERELLAQAMPPQHLEEGDQDDDRTGDTEKCRTVHHRPITCCRLPGETASESGRSAGHCRTRGQAQRDYRPTQVDGGSHRGGTGIARRPRSHLDRDLSNPAPGAQRDDE